MAAVRVAVLSWFPKTSLGPTRARDTAGALAFGYDLSEYRDLPESGEPRDRFILAGVNRMRPIAMTTLAAILALMPLALGWGQGSSRERPLAIAIIAGLAAQLPLALVVLPALLRILRVK
jgi:Cu/Ag efflux pump CusA